MNNIAVTKEVVQIRSWRVLMWPKEKEYWVWRTKLEVLQYRTGRSRILQKRMTNKMIFKRVMICSHPLENFINFREQPLTTKMFLLVLRKYYVTVIFLSMVLLMTVLKLIFWDQVFLIYACISIILCLINTIKTFTICGYNNTKISEVVSELQNVVGQASFIFIEVIKIQRQGKISRWNKINRTIHHIDRVYKLLLNSNILMMWMMMIVLLLFLLRM